VADRAYDSRKLRLSLARRKIELVCPHRSNRQAPSMQDGRALRRYRKRWKVERTFAWLQNFRRLLVRQDRWSRVDQRIPQLVGALISLNYL
jgi:transposase